ncbi:FliH/SctL family protein [Amnibacterium kyonggiense]|uniref:Flagellar assembly protein FliH n=1 Tax=Amnibacterium kyonggiense TaxID=595671 RepID=A0A4R7FQP0_9MICO|nr:FliH/SctL family protein [Amnibacterium kyonggiense]TDS80073.1 flagellar assembly protein FliH [Amnibacterium kyonggiense]
MSTSASFAPIAFPEMGTRRADGPTPVAAMPRVTPGYAQEEDMRTRPVAVRMTPLAYPELVKDETPEVRERARVQGHAAGYAAGRKAATETLATDRAQLRAEADRALGVQIDGLRSALEAVNRAAGELNAHTAMSLEGTEEAVLSAAIEIAGMILGRAISEDREGAAVAGLRRALEAAGPIPIRIVRMNPEDLELVSMVAADDPGLQLVADRHVSRGDAMVDLPDGVVDASIASAVERVRRALVGGDE